MGTKRSIRHAKVEAASVKHAADTPPTEGAPNVPAGFEPTKATVRKHWYGILDGQVAAAPLVATEITASTTYAADFGSHIAAPALASKLRLAADWSRETERTRAWLLYVDTQRRLAWNDALGDVNTLGRIATNVASIAANLASRYPALASFLNVRAAVAKRAAITRSSKESKKAASTPAPASHTDGSAATIAASAGTEVTKTA